MIALTNYISDNNPNVFNALGEKVMDFINFHLTRINNADTFLDKYDEKTINESLHLFTLRKMHII